MFSQPGYPPVVGHERSGLPFNINYAEHGPRAGLSSTETVPKAQRVFLDCRGPDSIQVLNKQMRAHMFQIERVTFTIPGGSTIPDGSTVFLDFNVLEQAGNGNWVEAQTELAFDNSTSPPTKIVTEDTNQTASGVLKRTVAVIMMGNVAPGDNVLWKNDLFEQQVFPGSSMGLKKIRVSIRLPDGSVWNDLLGARVFVQMLVWSESTLR